MSANLNTRILVTDGAGFLGSYVVERLRARGYTETLQNDRVAPTDPGVIPGKAPWTGGGMRGSGASVPGVLSAFDSADTGIYHPRSIRSVSGQACGSGIGLPERSRWRQRTR